MEIVIVTAGDARYPMHDVPQASRWIYVFAIFVYTLLTMSASLNVPYNDKMLEPYENYTAPMKGTTRGPTSPFIIAVQNAPNLPAALAGFINGCLYAAALTAA